MPVQGWASAAPSSGGGFKPDIPTLVDQYATKYGIPTDIARRQIKQESGFNPRAYNPSGAAGLGQLMPGTAAQLGVKDPYDPNQNLDGSFRYLKSQYEKYGNWQDATAAYNWGPGNVDNWIKKGRNPRAMPAETRNYIAAIAPMGDTTRVLSDEQYRGGRGGGLELLGGRGVQGWDTGVAGWDPKPQPQPTHASQAGIIPTNRDDLRSLGRNAKKAVDAVGKRTQPIRSAGATLAYEAAAVAQKGAGLFNAVLGAPQRAVAGAIAGDTKDDWNPLSAARGAWYGVTHSNDQRFEDRAEERLQISRFKTSGDPNPTFMGKLRNFVVDQGFQTLTDPLTYLGGFTARGAAKLLDAAENRITSKLRATASNTGEVDSGRLLAWMVPHANDHIAFSPKGRAVARGVRGQVAHHDEKIAFNDAALLKTHEAALKRGEVPDEVRQRLLQEAYTYGNNNMRKKALEYGYHATPEEEAANSGKPLGILNYGLLPDYFPHLTKEMKVPGMLNTEGMDLINADGMMRGKARFEMHQTHAGIPEGVDPVEAMALRLQLGRAVVKQRLSRDLMKRNMGLGIKGAKWKEFIDNPRAAQRIFKDPIDHSRIPGLAAITDKYSDFGRDALVGWNPIPHTKNITMLAYLAGGAPGVMRGLYYGLTHDVPKEIEQRLGKYGMATDFTRLEPAALQIGKASIAPIKIFPKWWRQGSTTLLTRIDNGMRAARLEQLDRELGKSTSEADEWLKASRVNDDMGAYRDSPAYAKFLRQMLGGYFPQWHNFIVPTTVGRALMRHPERVESVIRAEENLNKDVMNSEKTGYRVELGGPVEEGASAAEDPLRVLADERPKYILSPSSVGPIWNAILHMDSSGKSGGLDPVGGLIHGITPAIPGSNVAGPLTEYLGADSKGNKAPPWFRSVLQIFGSYGVNNPSAHEQAVLLTMKNTNVSRATANYLITRTKMAMKRYSRP